MRYPFLALSLSLFVSLQGCQRAVSQNGDGGTAITCETGTFRPGADALKCLPWSTCEAGQYERTAGTSTTDRECAPCESGTFSETENALVCVPWTTCLAGTAVARAPSAQSDRVCFPCPEGTLTNASNLETCLPAGACEAGTEQTAPATSTNAAVCTPCEAGTFCAGGTAPKRACGEGTWDDDGVAATPCVPWTICAPGSHVTSEGSPTKNRVCASCESGSYSSSSNAAECWGWTDCKPGQFVRMDGTDSLDRRCASCPAGWFSSTDNAVDCKPWSDCPAGSIVQSGPSASENRSCSPCAPGTITTGINQTKCHDATACPAGTVEVVAATSTAPAICAPCDAGTFCAGGSVARRACEFGTWDDDGSSTTPCVEWRTCSTGSRVENEGSAIADRQCVTCADGTFSATSNAVWCAPWRDCEPGTYEDAPGSDIQDRICLSCLSGWYSDGVNLTRCEPWTACPAGTATRSEPTSKNDRTCTSCPSGTFSTTTNATACTTKAACPVGLRDSSPQNKTADSICSCPSEDVCAAGGCAPGPNGDTVCQCNAGYEPSLCGGTWSCVNVDECDTSRFNSCPANALCTDTTGSFSCRCPDTGFESIGTPLTECRDINECDLPGDVCSGHVCTNLVGSHRCETACRPGYQAIGATCVDINECETNNGGCAITPLKPDGLTEWASSQWSAANPVSKCTNTVGSFTCGACPTGFKTEYLPDGSTRCVDVDECGLWTIEHLVYTGPIIPMHSEDMRNLYAWKYDPVGYEYFKDPPHQCSSRRKCENLPGNYRCTSCISGMVPDGPYMCKDVNECDPAGVPTDPAFYGDPSWGETDPNYITSYPKADWVNDNGIRRACNPNDDLRNVCSNVVPRWPGDRGWFCGSDFSIDEEGDPYWGEGMGPCSSRNGGCDNTGPLAYSAGRHAICWDVFVVNGGFEPVQCRCQRGFEGNGYDCFDINECNNRGPDCPESERCINLQGSYACDCAPPLVPAIPEGCVIPDRCLGILRCYYGPCKTIASGTSAITECGPCHPTMQGSNIGDSGCTCKTGFVDQNGSRLDGCEVSLAIDADNCGAMGTVCPSRPNAARVCEASQCGYECWPGFIDADGDAANGCEAPVGQCTSLAALAAAVPFPSIPVAPTTWLDAVHGVDVVRDSTAPFAVRAWRDRGGDGSSDVKPLGAVSAITATKYDPAAINGRPALVTSGQQVLTNNKTYGPSITIFVVAGMAEGAVPQRIVSAVNNDWSLGWADGYEDRANFGVWINNSQRPASTQPIIYSATLTTGFAHLWRNGRLITELQWTYAMPKGLSLGGDTDGEMSKARLGEVLIYEQVLTTEQRVAVQNYLSDKWGIPVAR